MNDLTGFFGPVIHSYTRAQAINDGVLVRVDPRLAAEAGFRVPVALTAAVWADCVTWTDTDDQRKHTCQDQTGRLWDVLSMAHLAAMGARGRTRVPVRLYRTPRQGRGALPRLVQLALVIGPGDQGEPAITIMQPHQD